ncbi:NAD(P)-binding protein [Gonapodya prolifera JEL478]|uniref:NAD(P)-binding protein n=1 Tax=Gonapodya prolifera (strain JEL478) TaxID=1344416 RepID=A0A139A3L6_GONPJ|nr:NAD(P)-binding protein [Gonapodya prolifera JEL478]|eukprot:KXS11371.1 NAD(P)-binding protein [Gonapodya prolifera JEL478]
MSLIPLRASEIPDLIAWAKFMFWVPYYSLLNMYYKWRTMPKVWTAKGKVCVITGCSAGLGEGLAKLWAKQGAHLVICARRVEPLTLVAKECESLGAASVTTVQVDVSVEADCEKLAKVAGEKFGRIDCLVLNAGISLGDIFEKLPLSAVHAVNQVNFQTKVDCTYYALPYLKKSTQPKIVPISSLGGLAGSPTRTGYSATKFALKGFFDALRNEYPGFLEVTLIYPGPVQTDLNRTRVGSMDLSWKGAMSVDEAVRLINRAVGDGKLEEVFTDAGKRTFWLRDWFPYVRNQLIVEKFNRLMVVKGADGTESNKQ